MIFLKEILLLRLLHKGGRPRIRDMNQQSRGRVRTRGGMNRRVRTRGFNHNAPPTKQLTSAITDESLSSDMIKVQILNKKKTVIFVVNERKMHPNWKSLLSMKDQVWKLVFQKMLTSVFLWTDVNRRLGGRFGKKKRMSMQTKPLIEMDHLATDPRGPVGQKSLSMKLRGQLNGELRRVESYCLWRHIWRVNVSW